MLLVFLTLIIFIIACIVTLRIEIDIQKLSLSNIKKIDKDKFTLKIRFYIFNYLKIVQIKLNNKKIKKILNNKKIDIKKIANKLPKNKKQDLKLLQALRVKKLYLKLEIGTIDIMITTFLIPIISTILSVLLIKSANRKNCYYKITPLYTDENIYNIDLNCIISIKIIHIISIMLKNINKGADKHERTSNRRSYAYSNE